MSVHPDDVIIPGLDEKEVSNRDREVENLFNDFGDVQLPAAPKGDAFASYVPLARYVAKSRADTHALIRAAVSIGELLGADGFYRFPAGDGTIEGPSIELAKALANRWGACGFGLDDVIDTRDDRCTVTGVCIDFLTLLVVRRPHNFYIIPPPAKFAKSKEQSNRWYAMQLQANAARALRGAILDCLPSWYWRPAFEAAKKAAVKAESTLKEGQTLAQAREEAITAFAALKVTREDLEAFLAMPFAEWGLSQVGELRVAMRQIKSKELAVEDLQQSKPEQAAADKSGLGLNPKPAEGGPATEKKSRKPRTEKQPAAPAAAATPTQQAALSDAALDDLVARMGKAAEQLGPALTAEVGRDLGGEIDTKVRAGTRLTDEELTLYTTTLEKRVESELAAWGGQK